MSTATVQIISKSAVRPSCKPAFRNSPNSEVRQVTSQYTAMQVGPLGKPHITAAAPQVSS